MADIDSDAHSGNTVKRILIWLERCSLAVEAPVNRWVRSPEFNPLYHTGPLAVFLTLVIIVSGAYLTMFYPFGFEASYRAVDNIESNLVGRVVRALHRYASDGLLVVTLLHGWRIFFMDRFRGPRWLAWLSGVGMTGVVWLAGVTGYWLVMDERAGLLNDTLVRLIGGWRAGAAFVVRTLTPSENNSGWVFILILITVHLAVTAAGGLFYWLHIKRLSRPKHFPPRFWMVASGLILSGAALLAPLGMLPQWQLTQLPGKLDIDLFYLFYLPAALKWPAAGLWGGALAAFALAGLAPWLLWRKPLAPVVVNSERCTGCTLCAADCPYQAIRMVDRRDGKRHKYLAQVDAKLCVACGVCIGACQPLALSLDGHTPDLHLEELVRHALAESSQPVRLVFTCERHALQAGLIRQPAGQGEALQVTAGDTRSLVIPMTCIGMVHPSLAENAIRAGAAQVQFIGCPPEDCTNREGNLWLARRLQRKRLPKLHLAYAQAPIRASWTAPDRFRDALGTVVRQAAASAYDLRLGVQDWRRLLPVLLLLLALMAAQVALSRVNFSPYPGEQALIEVQLDHQPGVPVAGAVNVVANEPVAGDSMKVVLEVGGQALIERTYLGIDPLDSLPLVERVSLAPGEAQVRLLLYDHPGEAEPQVLYDQVVELASGQILALHFIDVKLAGDVKEGERIFYGGTADTRAGCAICHSLEPGLDTVGPSLAGIAGRAAERVPGLSASEYLRQSILQPDAYLVAGFTAGQMPSNYEELLSDDEINDLLAFLAALK